MLEKATMSEFRPLDIGFWFPRPERGARLAQELRRRGHRVTIYHHLQVPGDQRHVRHVGYSLIGGLSILRTLRHDVFYTSQSFVPVLQLRLNKCLTGRPYVYTLNGAIWAYFGERGTSFRRTRGILYDQLLRLVLGGAAAVNANSEFLASQLKTRFPRHAAKVSTIYNGIDFDAIERGTASPAVWLPGSPRFLSVVTVNFKRKADGVRLLLDAFDIVSRRCTDATFLIAAKCHTEDVVASIRDNLSKHSCADRVKIDLNRPDVPDLLATTDVFAYATPPDSSDSLPRSLLEAQAAGVPTVTTDTTGCGEAVLNGRTGLVVPYDAGALADAALWLLDNPTSALQQASAAKKTVRDRFSWEIMATNYEHVFLRVTSPRRRSQPPRGHP